MVLGDSLVAAMAIGGGPAAQAQQMDPVGRQKNDCDSRGGPQTGLPIEGTSLVAKTGSSACRNFSQG
ncbi:hypothetical protein AB4Z54_47195 [Streptomyces sp. MCAF7]